MATEFSVCPRSWVGWRVRVLVGSVRCPLNFSTTAFSTTVGSPGIPSLSSNSFFLYFNADWLFPLGKWRVMGLKKTAVTLDVSAVGLESDHMNSDDLSGTPRVTCVCYFFLNCKHCEVCAVSTLCPQFQLLPVSAYLWSCEGRVGSWWWPCYPIGKWNTCGMNNGQFLLVNQKLLKDLLNSLLTSLLL